MKSAVNTLNEGFNNLYKKALSEDKSLREGTESNFDFYTFDDYEGVGYPHNNKEQALNAASSYIDLFMEKFDSDDVTIYVDVGIADGVSGDPIHQWEKNGPIKK